MILGVRRSMALHFAATSDGVATTSAPDYDADYTWLGWRYFDALPANLASNSHAVGILGA